MPAFFQLGFDMCLPFCRGKTSLLLQFAYNCARQDSSSFVTFICKPHSLDHNPPCLSQVRLLPPFSKFTTMLKNTSIFFFLYSSANLLPASSCHTYEVVQGGEILVSRAHGSAEVSAFLYRCTVCVETDSS